MLSISGLVNHESRDQHCDPMTAEGLTVSEWLHFFLNAMG